MSEFALELKQVIETRHEIIESGWPQSVSDSLALFGVKGVARKNLLQLLTVELEDIIALTGTVASLFVEDAFRDQEIKLRELLSAFAAG